MNRNFSLISSMYPQVILRTIGETDLENLRQWKNKNRQYFFFKGTISSLNQGKWFEDYLTRDHDYMFIVMTHYTDIGCLGFRLLNQNCDIYNVILGRPEMGKQHLMGKGFHIMCSYALEKYRTRLVAKVLLSNPFINWYKQNGFREVRAHPDHLEIELDQTAYQSCSVIEVHNSNK